MFIYFIENLIGPFLNTANQEISHLFLGPNGFYAGVFVLHRPARVSPLEPREGAVKRGPVAGFVAQGPNDHGGVVFVALRDAAHSRQVGGFEVGAAGEGGRGLKPDAVGLDVGFVHNVEPFFLSNGGRKVRTKTNTEGTQI
jgi:hypothetical protein